MNICSKQSLTAARTATDRCNNESGYSNEYMLKTKFNSRPVLYNRKYIIQPGLPKGTIVDTLMAEDADVGQTLTFYLDEENTCDVFSLDPVTGTLKVDKPEKLTNLTADTTFEVKAGVRDNGDIQLFDDALIWIELDIKTHISKPESEEKYFEIKPNPASSALEVHFFTKEKNSGGKIKILTGQGQIVYSKDYPVRFPETDLLDVSSILPGAYFIVIQTKEEKGTEKLIIVR